MLEQRDFVGTNANDDWPLPLLPLWSANNSQK
jgi:hypothetical protein